MREADTLSALITGWPVVVLGCEGMQYNVVEGVVFGIECFLSLCSSSPVCLTCMQLCRRPTMAPGSLGVSFSCMKEPRSWCWSGSLHSSTNTIIPSPPSPLLPHPSHSRSPPSCQRPSSGYCITVYHSFHKEYELYRKVTWRVRALPSLGGLCIRIRTSTTCSENTRLVYGAQAQQCFQQGQRA